MSRPQGHSAAGRIRSIEKSNDMGNRTRDFPVCSIVPQPTALPRALFEVTSLFNDLNGFMSYVYMKFVMLKCAAHAVTTGV
jgi:hypothetical protein